MDGSLKLRWTTDTLPFGAYRKSLWIGLLGFTNIFSGWSSSRKWTEIKSHRYGCGRTTRPPISWEDKIDGTAWTSTHCQAKCKLSCTKDANRKKQLPEITPDTVWQDSLHRGEALYDYLIYRLVSSHDDKCILTGSHGKNVLVWERLGRNCVIRPLNVFIAIKGVIISHAKNASYSDWAKQCGCGRRLRKNAIIQRSKVTMIVPAIRN